MLTYQSNVQFRWLTYQSTNFSPECDEMAFINKSIYVALKLLGLTYMHSETETKCFRKSIDTTSIIE